MYQQISIVDIKWLLLKSGFERYSDVGYLANTADPNKQLNDPKEPLHQLHHPDSQTLKSPYTFNAHLSESLHLKGHSPLAK